MKNCLPLLGVVVCTALLVPGVVVPNGFGQSGPRLVGTGPNGPFEYSPRSSSNRRPGLINPLCGTVGGPAIASSACDSQDGREWEGTASTDYFNYEPSVLSPPNPDIAAGPDDILTVVNRTISRYPNPNAPAYNNNNGTAPVAYNPANSYFFPPTSKNFLDVWVGEAALNQLCPTQPRSNASCVIDNATVRYDQMQGRFLVLFTVTDTAYVNCPGCATASPGTVRRASWVLIVSRWATGCQGTGGGFTSSCVPNTNPAVSNGTGNTEFFTTPQPPGPNQSNPNSGGVNSNWLIYYGAVGNASTSQQGDGICPAGGCNFGNINDISDIRRGLAPTQTIDCNVSAIGDSTKVCYFPVTARLGIDNDNITLVSSVYDDNIPLDLRSIDPSVGVGANVGTRVRTLKKAAFYFGGSSTPGCATVLCPGATNVSPKLQGDFYDLWTVPYTVDPTVPETVNIPGVGIITLNVPGVIYEPVHVRGRSLASFNGNANLDNAFTNLLGAFSIGPGNTDMPQNVLYLRTIIYGREVPGSLPPNGGGIAPVVNNPLIQGGIPSLLPNWELIPVPTFTNPDSIDQRAKLVQGSPNNTPTATPYLMVGDDRPHRAISREGHIYDARVTYLGNFNRFDGARGLISTVSYDLIQKLRPAAAPLLILNTNWNNGLFFSPMFDTPANVVQYGSISPINLLPYLEKLFVGTTFPPLALTDPRTFAYGNIAGQALVACKGQDPAVGSTNLAYAGLFDIRCGEDAYDTYQALRHPISGSWGAAEYQTRRQPTGLPNQIVPFGIRGGASTDPNNMGLWLYGAYAKGRLASVPGFGQWGTYVAHYPLSFPIRDPYNNLNATYTDVPQTHPHFVYVQIAKQTEIDPGSRAATTFNPDGTVLRRDMARWVTRAQMDENAITSYLNSTGGIYCSFADVACPGSSGNVTNTTGATTDWRYIETMYRRGYTKGCQDTNDGQRRFCPDRTLSRGEMAVFLIRAKMNSVFPTVTSGAFTTTTCQPAGTQVTQVGDQFGLFAGCNPYFGDVPNTHPYFAFIQKMRELRITNGTSLSSPGVLGTYSPDASLKRSELMTFLVRAFFP